MTSVEYSEYQKLTARVTLSPVAHSEIAVLAPFNGAVLGRIPVCRVEDAQLAFAHARAAQPEWAERSFGERGRIFLRFHDLLLKRQDEVLDLIQLETGKARRHAFEEILDTAVVSRYYSRRARKLLRTRRRKGALPFLTKTWERRVPLGVAGFIVPWNYPLNLAITDAVPALLAGNTAVLKPDSQASLTALWVTDLLYQAGLPRDVLCVITGEGPVLGPAVVECADYVMFTGSTRTGRLVARQAAERLIGCSLELGGKNPQIILRDADLQGAVEGAIRGSFAGAGQVCVHLERIYVDQSISADFLRLFAERARNLKMGPALDYSIDMGSLTSERQLRTVEEHVRDALERGATLVSGGHHRPDLGPFFYEPTILTEVRPGMKLYAEETFGPVVSVYPFATEDEAVAKANDAAYGLNASIWTRDIGKALALARRIHAGSVNVNESYAATWGSVDSPLAGWKESGLGCRHGAEGMLKFTQTQTVAAQRILPIGPARWMNPSVHARWMTRLVKWLRRIRVMG